MQQISNLILDIFSDKNEILLSLILSRFVYVPSEKFVIERKWVLSYEFDSTKKLKIIPVCVNSNLFQEIIWYPDITWD